VFPATLTATIESAGTPMPVVISAAATPDCPNKNDIEFVPKFTNTTHCGLFVFDNGGIAIAAELVPDADPPTVDPPG